MPESTNNASVSSDSYHCVECGAAVKKLVIHYSKDVIQLAKCNNCGQLADKYIEYERLVLVLDVLLHKLAAIRHLLHNQRTPAGSIWRGLLLLIICEAYVLWLDARDLSSDLTSAVFTAAKEIDFYCKLAISLLQCTVMILALMSNEFVHTGDAQLHKTAKLVLITGCCRILLLPLLAWRSVAGVDLFFWLSFLLTFTLTFMGVMAMRHSQAIHFSLLETALACNSSRLTVTILVEAMVARQLGVAMQQQRQVAFKPISYQFFLAE